MRLFLVEFYTVGPNGETGYDIRFAWVKAKQRADILPTLKKNVPEFEEVILATEQGEVTRLRLRAQPPVFVAE